MVSSRPVCRYNNTSKNWFKGEQCTFEHNRTPEAEEQRLMAARAKRNKQGTVQVTGDSNHIKGQGTVRPDGNEVIMQTPNGVMSGNEGMVETALGMEEGWVLPGSPSLLSWIIKSDREILFNVAFLRTLTATHQPTWYEYALQLTMCLSSRLHGRKCHDVRRGR
eukprot:GHVN01031297.1.p2 GENE.GHVN01031297.1~~GHVN01031297.1.p2  ORF type:complete len:164 (+),score=20.29 GHVN01031297.1:483-974(+)